jgi:hypothetical protein
MLRGVTLGLPKLALSRPWVLIRDYLGQDT